MIRRTGIVLAIACLGCASQETSTPRATSQLPEPEGLREEALLLLMADRRYYDSFTVGSIRFENPKLAGALATSLGRIRDPRALPVLHQLLVEGKPEVRREAAFALGIVADPASSRHLLAALTDADDETAMWAAAGLAEIGVELDRVLRSLETRPPRNRRSRLAPVLFRFPPQQRLGVATAGLRDPTSEVRALSAFALARTPQLESIEVLRGLIDDPDPWVRGWAARALGQIGDRSDMDRLRVLLEAPEQGPVIQALRAAHRLVGSGLAAPAADWRPHLLRLIHDSRSGVSLTAIEASAVWLLDEDLGGELVRLARHGPSRQQEVALLALAESGDPRASDLATRLVTDASERQRALSASVAARLSDREVLSYLSLDPSALVRGAALAGLLESDAELASASAIAALSDEDPGMRAQVLQWLADHPVAPADLVSRAILGVGSREVTDLRLFGIRALLARGQAQPLERGLVVQNLESLARVGQYPARIEAARALVELDRPEPVVGPAGSQRSTTTYMQVVLQTDQAAAVEILTPHGRLELELDCAQARMTCLNFLQLARQGFYDGQIFHRVVPDFVVQAGDPRGDGWGGPGYTIRDEWSRQPFRRGVLGMARSAPDTGGSQFFITLSRQPQLDGRYTAFGRVVRGDEVLDRLEQGDRLERVVVVR